jgi:hypothetical protein
MLTEVERFRPFLPRPNRQVQAAKKEETPCVSH